MNIPDKAMDAAFQAVSKGVEFHMDDRMYWEQAAKDMLEAAAPFIAADIREELCLVKAERDWMKEQLGRLHLDALGKYADSLEDPQ